MTNEDRDLHDELITRSRDLEWKVSLSREDAKKSERLSNFALGFSTFTLVFILLIELLIKK